MFYTFAHREDKIRGSKEGGFVMTIDKENTERSL